MVSVIAKAKHIRFGGIQKSSLIDFPGRVSCVLFVMGCNFRCPYCHNPELVKPNGSFPPTLDNSEINRFLETRKDLLDGVVISGGEPTLQPGLFSFCQQLKAMGYWVKLDTNGSRPDIIRELLKARVVDYIAMDIKSHPGNYSLFSPRKSISSSITESINLIMNHCTEYEFRTTCMKPIISKEVIKKIASGIRGAKLYALQKFRQEKVLDPDFFRQTQSVFTQPEMEQLRSVAENWVQHCIIR